MSLPQRLYELYREVAGCALVQTHQPTPENMLAFQDLLNKSWPIDEAETYQRNLVRGMYNSRQRGFVDYVSVSRNRVGALILWTESKSIARYFGLNGVVHISWDEDKHTYAVSSYIPREMRVPTASSADPANTAARNTNSAASNQRRGPQRGRLSKPRTNGSNRGVPRNNGYNNGYNNDAQEHGSSTFRGNRSYLQAANTQPTSTQAEQPAPAQLASSQATDHLDIVRRWSDTE